MVVINFKEILDINNVEYHLYENENIFTINYNNAEDSIRIKKLIENICKENGFINGLNIKGRAVLEISNNPNFIKELGFKSETYG